MARPLAQTQLALAKVRPHNELNFPLLFMFSFFNRLSLQVSAAALALAYHPKMAWAQLFGEVPELGGGTTQDVRTTILDILKRVLEFMALIAVVFIVIAGIRLVVSQGEDAEKDKAKKTILYVVIGLIVILLAQAIVNFLANTLVGS